MKYRTKKTYEWCLDLTDSIASWLNTLYDAQRPGEIHFCRRGNLIEPSRRSGLGASCLALKVAYQTGIWEQLDRKVREGWVSHVCSFQRKSSGFFEDPALLVHADENAGRLWFKKEDTAIRRAETRQAAAALLAVGGRPLYPVVEIPETTKDALNYLKNLPWHKNSWGSGSQASHLVFFLKLNADVFNQGARLEKLLPSILHFLDELQDRVTGSWFRKKAHRNQKVNAAMKVLTIYRLLGQSFLLPERLIDLGLSAVDDRDACHSVDVLFVLHECAQWTSHRRDEIMDFCDQMLGRIRRHLKPDGAFSFYPDRANTTYYGVPVSKGLSESDVHGTHLLVWAVTLCANLLGFYSELGWRFPVT